MNKLAYLTLAFALLFTNICKAETFVTIGTGGQTGNYYAAGQAICKLVNIYEDEHGIKCIAPSTGGSVSNLNAIKARDMDFGIAQSDWQYHAYAGSNMFEEQGPNSELRTIFSIYSEPVTIVKKIDSSPFSCPGCQSGCRCKNSCSCSKDCCSSNRDILFGLAGISGTFSYGDLDKQIRDFCDDQSDLVIINGISHPNGSVKEAVECRGEFVELDNESINSLINDNSFYSKSKIKSEMYDLDQGNIETFGTGATFVASTNVDEETVYQIVKTVFDNYDRLKKIHPVFHQLEEEEMINNYLSAPLHSGAVKYYKEKGWM